MTRYQKQTLDGLWSKIVRLRDHFTCQRCGAVHKSNSKGLHAHHILTKGSHGFSTRWSIENGVAVCYGCHMLLQGNPDENEKFAREELNLDYDNMKFIGKTTVKVFYSEKRQELKNQLLDLMVARDMRDVFKV